MDMMIISIKYRPETPINALTKLNETVTQNMDPRKNVKNFEDRERLKKIVCFFESMALF